ncbi:MAG: metallopeptidase TldD-related protein [Nakamurella sp.]
MSGLLTPQQIVEAALAASTADGTIVVVQAGTEANVRWANNTVTTNGFATSLSWFVVAVSGGAAGTVAASAASADSAAAVAEVVAAAHEAAKAAAQSGRAQDEQPLIEPANGPSQDFAAAPEPTSFAVFGELLETLAAAFDSARSGERILYGFARHEMTTIYLGSSTGLRLRWVQPTGLLELNAKSADLQRSAWSGISTADFRGIDVNQVAAGLTTRLDWASRTVELPPGRYDTVLPPTAGADFIVYLAWSAGGRAAHEGRSAFSAPGGGTKIGQRLTERKLDLFSDPTAPGLASTPFLVASSSGDEQSVFDNGAEVGRFDLLDQGVLRNLLHTRGSAAEFGATFVPSCDNLVLSGGTAGRSLDELVAGLGRGLLVTSQWYLREVDPMTMLLTGLTRDGVFLVENGEITGAVNNFRFNVSPLDVLRQAADIGETVPTLSREWSDWFTRTAMPPMLVEGFNMSSVSKAQ